MADSSAPASRFTNLNAFGTCYRCTRQRKQPVSHGMIVRGGHAEIASDPAVGWVAVRSNRIVPGVASADVVFGVACVAFGIGRHGAAWLRRLSRSDWFSGLEPLAQDLAPAGGRAAWSVPLPATPDKRALCPIDLPQAPMATVAVSRFASDAELAATIRLVRELRRRRSDSRMRMAVVATVEHGADVAVQLAAEGAFVIEGGADVSAQHLHHFPLRAAIQPRAGRVVCADLADHLATWPSGRRSRLHLVPAEADAAERRVRLTIGAGAVSAGAKLLNLHWLQRDWRRGALAELDRLAVRMMEVFGDASMGCVYTDAEPIEDPGELADLLLLTN